jgi:hypothetical protein
MSLREYRFDDDTTVKEIVCDFLDSLECQYNFYLEDIYWDVNDPDDVIKYGIYDKLLDELKKLRKDKEL